MSKLLDLLPEQYKNSEEVIALQNAFGKWTDALNKAREDLFLQLDVRAATWGLSTWEKALGLKTDISRPYDYRRTRIESKLRGLGTTTRAMIQNVAESFSNGEVDIIEYARRYHFDIRFIGARGIPPNLDDLSAAIEEIKPAHLAYAYIFTYLTWNEFDAYYYTWDEWGALSLTWDEFEVYKE